MSTINISKELSMEFFTQSIEKYGGVRKTAKLYNISAAAVSRYASGKMLCSQRRYKQCKALYDSQQDNAKSHIIFNITLSEKLEEVKETLDILGYELIIEVRKKV